MKIFLTFFYCRVVGTFCFAWTTETALVRGPCGASPLLLHSSSFNQSFEVFGTNAGLPPYRNNFQNANNCLVPRNSGVSWYLMPLSEGESVDLSFGNEYTNFPAVVQIFTGNCRSLTCETIATTKSTASFYVSEGGIYYFAVFGTNNTAGNTTIEVF